VPNSFLPKLISYLHIKGYERHKQNHNPEPSLCFSRPGTERRQRAFRELREAKGGLSNSFITHFFLRRGCIKHCNQAIFEFQCAANERCWNCASGLELGGTTRQQSKWHYPRKAFLWRSFSQLSHPDCVSLDKQISHRLQVNPTAQ